MIVSFGDTYEADFYSEVCGNADDAVARSVTHTYASADSYYCHISAGRVYHYGNWDVFEQCTSAEGFVTVH
jgi:hypothetical protein